MSLVMMVSISCKTDDEVNIFFCLFGNKRMQHLFCVNYSSMSS